MRLSGSSVVMKFGFSELERFWKVLTGPSYPLLSETTGPVPSHVEGGDHHRSPLTWTGDELFDLESTFVLKEVGSTCHRVTSPLDHRQRRAMAWTRWTWIGQTAGYQPE